MGELTREGLLKWRLKRPNVAVGIPMTEVIWRTAFWNFMFLCRHGLKNGDEIIPTIKVAVPAEARNNIIEAFLAMPKHVKYLLMFDSDMVVPIEAVDVLTGYDVPIISGYATYKTWPYHPVPSIRGYVTEVNGEQVQNYRNMTDLKVYSGVHRCDGTGGAALCVRRDLLEAMEPPYFWHGIGGEDYYFCEKVQKTVLPEFPEGVPIFVSTDVPVGHIGEVVATPQMWFDNKEKWYAENPDEGEAEFLSYGPYGEEAERLEPTGD